MSFNDLGDRKGLRREPGKVGKGRRQEMERLTGKEIGNGAVDICSANCVSSDSGIASFYPGVSLALHDTEQVYPRSKYPSQRAEMFLEKSASCQTRKPQPCLDD